MAQRRHFDYTDADVIVNREGVLTDAQRTHLDALASAYRQRIGWRIVSGALVVVVLIFAVFVQYGGTLDDLFRSGSRLPLIAAGIFLVALVVVTIYTASALREIRNGTITMMTGTVKTITRNVGVLNNPVYYYELHITHITPTTSDLIIHLDDAEQLSRFEVDQRYNLYTVHFITPILLSAERVA